MLRELRTRRSVARLAEQLGAAPPPGALRDALARALLDDSLEIAYWLPDQQRYVDAGGHHVEPRPGPAQTATTIARDGQPLAVVIHDRSLAATHDLEREIGAASRLAVDNERLRAEALAQLADLRAARARIVEAADDTRRQLERNLHDGAQQRLLALSYELQLAEADATATGDPRLAAVLATAGQKVATALVELRDLAHGIFPVILTEAGLGAALATYVDTAPLRVDLAGVPDERVGDDAEIAAYLSVVAVIERAVHRSASRLDVTFTRSAADLDIDSVDDADREPPRRSDPRRRSRRRPRRTDRRERQSSAGGHPVRVVVADDALLTREGIVHLLAGAGVDVVAEVEDADTLMREVARLAPDVAVVDIRMPPTHTDEGLVAAQRIRDEYPDVAVLVLSQYLEPSYAMRLLEAHPEKVGYLLKERVFAAAVLVDALRRVDEGETVVDPTIVSRLFGRHRDNDPLATLSPREHEVLALVAEGRSNKAIGTQLHLADRTVEAHITQIFLKLGVDSSPDSHRRVLAVLTFLRR